MEPALGERDNADRDVADLALLDAAMEPDLAERDDPPSFFPWGR